MVTNDLLLSGKKKACIAAEDLCCIEDRDCFLIGGSTDVPSLKSSLVPPRKERRSSELAGKLEDTTSQGDFTDLMIMLSSHATMEPSSESTANKRSLLPPVDVPLKDDTTPATEHLRSPSIRTNRNRIQTQLITPSPTASAQSSPSPTKSSTKPKLKLETTAASFVPVETIVQLKPAAGYLIYEQLLAAAVRAYSSDQAVSGVKNGQEFTYHLSEKFVVHAAGFQIIVNPLMNKVTLCTTSLKWGTTLSKFLAGLMDCILKDEVYSKRSTGIFTYDKDGECICFYGRAPSKGQQAQKLAAKERPRATKKVTGVKSSRMKQQARQPISVKC